MSNWYQVKIGAQISHIQAKNLDEAFKIVYVIFKNQIEREKSKGIELEYANVESMFGYLGLEITEIDFNNILINTENDK